MDFVDEVVITVKSGDGGNGCISFRREKYIPKGGPDGGDGGKGGDVILRATSGIYSLSDFIFKRFFKAKKGSHGKGKNQTGKDGKDLIINVPIGTVIKDETTGNIIADLINEGEEVVIAKGGRGGRGNQHFATSTFRTPRIAEPGEPGMEKKIRLILKSIADIGLVGFPNVGKSTLLSKISRAKPKIASYPFTTLSPNLGVVALNDSLFITIADIPGLIKGAHVGKGLGYKFLRHIERTKLILYVIDITFVPAKRLLEDLDIIQEEMRKYKSSLLYKPQIVAINKIDLYDPTIHRSIKEIMKALSIKGIQSFPISAFTGEGIDNLKKGISEVWNQQKKLPILEQTI